MLITYVGRLNAPVEVPEFGLVVTPGEPVEVPQNVAERLLEQPDNWQTADTEEEE